jgi:hypothetical protein
MKNDKENAQHKMSIAGLPKICSCRIDTTDNNVFRRNKYPGNKTGNDQKYYSNQTDPFHVAHKETIARENTINYDLIFFLSFHKINPCEY